jgi:transcription-repair coupling factor (superfamily II helicase)
VDIARLRVEAMRVGLTEILKLRDEVRMSPVLLAASQEVRLKRLAPRAVLRSKEGTLFIPAPEDLVGGLLRFLQQLWPPD